MTELIGDSVGARSIYLVPTFFLPFFIVVHLLQALALHTWRVPTSG